MTIELINKNDVKFRSYYILLVIQFLSLIPEQGAKMTYSFKDGKIASYKVAEYCGFTVSNVLPYFNDPDINIQAAALSCISSWSSHSTINTESFMELLDHVVLKLNNIDLIETTSDVLMNLLGDSRLSGMEKTVPTKLYPVLCSYSGYLLEALKG